MSSPISWPEGKAFAFTVFDDPDSQTVEAGREIYAFLADLGFRTTKAVWPVRGGGDPSDHGGTCAEPEYRAWVQGLQARGFEIAFHNATLHTSRREETARALEEFRALFGSDPKSFAQHYFCNENVHWGDHRASRNHRLIYNLATGGRNHRRFHGSTEGHPEFWGDICRNRIKYVRNFVFAGINTLKLCPQMPYHDPERPYVNYWFAASEGAKAPAFIDRITEAAQDRLEQERGACIMYTHFGHGYHDGGLDPRFRQVMTRLAKRNGWFVPVSELLDFLLSRKQGKLVISAAERTALERRWLMHKLRFGTA